MSQNRRNFLKKSGMLASGLVMGSFAAKALKGTPYSIDLPGTGNPENLQQFGLQLWTVKDVMAKDPQDTLKQVSSFGYKQIEGFEGGKGMFWGMTNKEFKKTMDGLGMQFISCHADINNANGQFEKKAAQAAEIGMKYLICPYYGAQKTLDGYKIAADKFNACGEICKKNSLRFAYHNHWYTFQIQDGLRPQEILLKNTDPALVDYEMDIYWVVTAGADPVEWLQKYPNRFRLCHIKDRIKNAGEKDFDASCDLGTGSIDFNKIAKVAAGNGMQYYIVEQEKFNGTTLDAAKVDAGYMKKLDV
ncbi:MAG TPA: sugar phosphate isomerase/epimerase [Puia sp.]|nr:sugar phosphate isomerase/epimerase [Puia sp.]